MSKHSHHRACRSGLAFAVAGIAAAAPPTAGLAQATWPCRPITHEVSTWYGLWAPQGMPPAVVERMTSELKNALASKEIQTAWASIGAEPPTLSGNFGDFVAAETKRWAEVVKVGNIKAD